MSRFEEIEAFAAVMKAGSITGAANRLGVAKSVVSRRLSDLEARLGVQLIVRTTRKLSLTDAGADFLPRAEALLDDLAEAEAAASAGQTRLSGRLRVAAPLSFGLRHLRPVISDFIGQHPDIEIEIDFSDRFVDLVGEGFDVGVRIGALADTSLIGRRLCAIRAAVAAAPSFWKRHGVPTHPDDLSALPLLAYDNAPRRGAVDYWGPKGETGVLTPSVRTLANNGDFLMDLAADGHGFIVQPKFFLHDHQKAGAIETVLSDYEWLNAGLYVLYPPVRQVSARVRAFVDAVIAAFPSKPSWERT
ncbi:MAG: LysR family transcriptional regulator [Pseudomonadota bacterium]